MGCERPVYTWACHFIALLSDGFYPAYRFAYQLLANQTFEWHLFQFLAYLNPANQRQHWHLFQFRRSFWWHLFQRAGLLEWHLFQRAGLLEWHLFHFGTTFSVLCSSVTRYISARACSSEMIGNALGCLATRKRTASHH